MIGARLPSGLDYFLLLLMQHGEDLNTMRAEPAGVMKKLFTYTFFI